MAVHPSLASSFDDPRITDRFLRTLAGDDRGDCVLVGVVHDHPASVYRARTVVDAVGPETLALELPPAAVPLYRAYAGEGPSPPRFGGEMSAAIRAADEATVSGIDAPNWSFCRRLVTRLVADRVPALTAGRVVSSLGAASREAVACRVAATLTNATSMTVTRDDPIEYDCTHEDAPQRQADHERAHVGGIQALLSATDGSALEYRDGTREQCMIDRLERLRERGDVVAVVGVDHLDPLEAALSDGETS